MKSPIFGVLLLERFNEAFDDIDRSSPVRIKVRLYQLVWKVGQRDGQGGCVSFRRRESKINERVALNLVGQPGQ